MALLTSAHRYIDNNPTSCSFRGFLAYIGRTKSFWKELRERLPEAITVENMIYDCIAADSFRRSNVLLELLKDIEELSKMDDNKIELQLRLICSECGKEKVYPEIAEYYENGDVNLPF
jgi:hypothetical protein